MLTLFINVISKKWSTLEKTQSLIKMEWKKKSKKRNETKGSKRKQGLSRAFSRNSACWNANQEPELHSRLAARLLPCCPGLGVRAHG